MFTTDGDINQPVDVYCLVTNTFVTNDSIARLIGVTKQKDPEAVNVANDIRFDEGAIYTEDWEEMIDKRPLKKRNKKIKPVLAFCGAKILKVLSDVYHYLAAKDMVFLITFIQYRFTFGVDDVSNRELKIVTKCYEAKLCPPVSSREEGGGPHYKLAHFLDAMALLFNVSEDRGLPFRRYVERLKIYKDTLCAWSYNLIKAMGEQAEEFRDLDQSLTIIANNFFFKHFLRASPYEMPVKEILQGHAADIKRYIETRTRQIRDFIREKTSFRDDVATESLKRYRFRKTENEDKKLMDRRGFGFNHPLTVKELTKYVQSAMSRFYRKDVFFLYRANAFNAIKVVVQLGSAVPAFDCETGQTSRINIMDWVRSNHSDGLTPGTPLFLVSMDPSRKQYRYQTLTDPAIWLNKVYLQDGELQRRIAAHFFRPCWETHKYCVKRVSRLCAKHKLCFHEYINPGLPVYTLAIDVDSKSDRFSVWLSSGDKWSKRVELVTAFENVILTLYRDYVGIEDCRLNENISVFVYETLPSSSTSRKRGFRVIIKCKKVVFESIRPVYAILDVLQILMNRDPILKLAGKTSIDKAMYLNGYASLRLPLCGKSAVTGEGCLAPLLVDPAKVRGQLIFTAFLIHHKPVNYCNKRVKIIYHVPTVSARMIREATSTESIHRDMYASKFQRSNERRKQKEEGKRQPTISTIRWFERHKDKLVRIRNSQTSRLIPSHERAKLAKSCLIKVTNGSSKGYYKWADKVYFCPHKQHRNEQDHPCSYSVKIRRRKQGPVTIRVFAWCWGSECYPLKNKSVKTLIIPPKKCI